MILILGLLLGQPWPAAAQEETRSIRRVSGARSAGAQSAGARSAAGAEQRQALVIGNARYQPYELSNPVNDARAFAGLLRSLGFEVDELTNGDRRAMKEAIRTFTQSLRAGSVGIFYYAGHAIQVDGANYLIPLAADIRDATDVEYESVPLGFLLDKMGEATDRLNIVILDACRNNPFPWSRGSEAQGLAKAHAPVGTLIAYATAPGRVALDGRDRNGIFTKHLLMAMRIPGLKIEDVLKKTRASVLEATGKKQVPWVSTSLVGDFVPFPLASPPAPVFQPTPSSSPPPMPSSGESDKAAQLRSECDWGDAWNCTMLGFMYNTGNGVTRDEARAAQLFRWGCDGGHIPGCSHLGYMYSNGRGVAQDDTAAVGLYRQACDGGDVPGCSNLGVLYSYGKGVDQDEVEAVRLFRRGCDGGHYPGCSNLGAMYSSGKGVARDQAEAARLFRQGCGGGHGWGCTQLGRLCSLNPQPACP